ncbi:MAG: hypothetical protein CM15mP51_01730 [Porticoccaceae bacterium]|nr:MAG: hypothetical protein CM15mP51_01730 [Porticoccaceae bacterium]
MSSRVDLVLSGHDHTYARTGSIDFEGLGTFLRVMKRLSIPVSEQYMSYQLVGRKCIK